MNFISKASNISTTNRNVLVYNWFMRERGCGNEQCRYSSRKDCLSQSLVLVIKIFQAYWPELALQDRQR